MRPCKGLGVGSPALRQRSGVAQVVAGLRPFFCYYGGKWRSAPRYPKPEYDTIIEPFAGAAGYATRYANHRVILVERDAGIAALWRYLIAVRADEIRRLPDVPEGGTTDDLQVSTEARSLIGFWLNKGASTPHKSPSSWMRAGIRPDSYWGPAVRERLSRQVERIRHWEVVEGSYEEAPDIEASWFIDPPYERMGKFYRERVVDYVELATWCQARKGQAIVCEAEGATWLPFKPFGPLKGTPGEGRVGYTQEACWTNTDADDEALREFMFGRGE